MKLIFRLVFVIIWTSSYTAMAQQISCGDRPKIQSSVEDKLKVDAEGQAQLLTRLLGNADIKGAVETSRNELYQQHRDVDREEIDLYFAWISCQQITLSKDLSSTEKLEKWILIYKILRGRYPSDRSDSPNGIRTPSPVDSSVFFIEGLKFTAKRLVFVQSRHEVTLVISATNINDYPTKIVFLSPYPTLTDEDGNSGHFTGTEGVQICGYDAVSCARLGRLFSVQPNFPVNIIVRFRWPGTDARSGSASFTSKLAIYRDDKTNMYNNPIEVSLAFPDIPFASN